MYEQGYLLTVTAENGTLDTGTGKWTAEQNQQKTVVKAGGALTLRFTPGVGNGLKRLNKDGVDDTAKAVKQEDGTVTYRLEGISKDTVVAATFDTLYTVTFVDAAGKAIGAEQVVKDQTLTAERFAHYAELAKVDGKAFFTWQRKGTQEIVNSRKAVTESLELTPVYKDRVGTGTETGTDGLQAVIGADHFAMNVADVAGLTKEAVLERAVAEAIGKDGVKLQAGAITVGQLDALQGLQQAGNVNLTLTAEDASVTVAVTVVDVAPVMMGRTAYTISFTGEPNTEYTVAAETGTPVTVLTDGTGKGVAENLTKGTAYTIGSPIYGKTTAKTSGEDAKEIAEKFKTGTEETVTSGAGGDQEQASNDNVLVTVGSDGNYLVTLKQDVNRSVVVADNWGAITIDLNGNTIKGDDATARGAAKSGLEFAAGADDGTDVTIVDTKGGGKVQGGNGLPQYPDGAAGIGVATGAPEGSAVTVGEHAAVVGGAGATNENGAGGSGGAGIAGAIPVTVDGGKVNGGAGGAGAPGAEGKISGLGGRGGTGIQVDKQDVTVKKGTVTGGQGGTGGQGVVGTSTGNGTILAGADGMHGDLKLSEIAIGRLGTGNVLATYTDGSGMQRVDEPVTGSSIFVMRNTNVTLKFVGQDLGKTRAVSKDFTILTALNVDATSVELEGTMEFDWTDKSYTYDLNAGNRGHVVEAVFRNAHLVEVEISGATVTFPQGVKVNGNRAIVLEGDSLTLALTPDEALGILPVAKATLNGAEVTLGNDYTYTIQNIAGSQVFQVEFGKHPFVETVITEVTETSIGFIGEANAQYTVQGEEDLYIVVTTDANGAGLVTGLKPGTEYTITHPVHGAVKGRTLVGNAIGTSEKGQMTETAKTGDSTNIIFSVALGAVAVAYAAIVLLKRRRTR